MAGVTQVSKCAWQGRSKSSGEQRVGRTSPNCTGVGKALKNFKGSDKIKFVF